MDPAAVEAASRSLFETALVYATKSSRLRSLPMPAMPPSHASNVQSALGTISGRLSNVAESLASTSDELARRAALLRTSEAGAFSASPAWFLPGLLLEALADAQRSGTPPFDSGFIAAQGAGALAKLLEERPSEFRRWFTTIDEAVAQAGNRFDVAEFLHRIDAPPEATRKLLGAGYRVTRLRYSRLVARQARWTKGIHWAGKGGGLGLAVFDAMRSNAATTEGKVASAALTHVLTKSWPGMAIDAATGGGASAGSDLIAITAENLVRLDMSLDDYVAWDAANRSGENGWVMKEAAEAGDAIADATEDSMTMYNVDSDTGEMDFKWNPLDWF